MPSGVRAHTHTKNIDILPKSDFKQPGMYLKIILNHGNGKQLNTLLVQPYFLHILKPLHTAPGF